MKIKSFLFVTCIGFIAIHCSEKKDYQQLNAEAVELSNQEKTDEALQVLDLAIASYPDSMAAYSNKMSILVADRAYEALGQMFDLMIVRKVNHQTAYAYKGILS